MNTESKESAGVQQLIDRLHREGVEKGKEQADELLVQARRQSMELLDNAKREAEELLSEARAEAERTRRGGEDAVRLAGRDAILSLTEDLRLDFEKKLKNLVGKSLQDRELLRDLVLEIVRAANGAESGPRKILFLNDSLDPDSPANMDDAQLDAFVQALGGEALRDGLTFEISESDAPGVRVQVVDDELEIDLTTETLTALLLKHLSPRFRRLMQED